MTLKSFWIIKATTSPSSNTSSTRGVPFHDYHDAARAMAYVGSVIVGSSAGLLLPVVNAAPPNPGPVLIKLRWNDFERLGQSSLRSGQDPNPLSWVDIASGEADDKFQTRYISTLYARYDLVFVHVRQMSEFVSYEDGEISGTASLSARVFWEPFIWQQITTQVSTRLLLHL